MTFSSCGCERASAQGASAVDQRIADARRCGRTVWPSGDARNVLTALRATCVASSIGYPSAGVERAGQRARANHSTGKQGVAQMPVEIEQNAWRVQERAHVSAGGAAQARQQVGERRADARCSSSPPWPSPRGSACNSSSAGARSRPWTRASRSGRPCGRCACSAAACGSGASVGQRPSKEEGGGRVGREGSNIVRVRHFAVARVAATKRAALLEQLRTGRSVDGAVDAASACDGSVRGSREGQHPGSCVPAAHLARSRLSSGGEAPACPSSSNQQWQRDAPSRDRLAALTTTSWSSEKARRGARSAESWPCVRVVVQLAAARHRRLRRAGARGSKRRRRRRTTASLVMSPLRTETVQAMACAKGVVRIGSDVGSSSAGLLQGRSSAQRLAGRLADPRS